MGNWRTILSHISGDFRLWIILFFLIRLIHITYPPLEPSHNWRQAVTLSTARHFFEDGPELLYPKTDIAGADRWNVIAGEFPFFNYLIYLASLLFGYEHWYGRLINLFISSWGIYAFYRFLKDRCNATHALFAGLLLLTSVWFMFSRKIMPDTFSCALVLIGVRQADLYFRREKQWHVIAFILTVSVGLLVKLPAAILMIFLWPVITDRTQSLHKKLYLAAAAVIAVVPAFWWYYYWVPSLLQRGAFQLYFPYSLIEGWHQLKPCLHLLPGRFYFTSFFSFTAAILWLGGLILMARNRHPWSFVFLIAFPVLIYFILKTGSVFALHDYYIIPFVPFMAWWAGYIIAKTKYKKQLIIIAVIAMCEGLLNQQHDLRRKYENEYKLDLEAFADKHLEEDEPLAILSDGNPSDMYFAHRSGWTVKKEELSDSLLINRMINSGCRYLLVVKENPYNNAFRLTSSVAYGTKDFDLIDLRELP